MNVRHSLMLRGANVAYYPDPEPASPPPPPPPAAAWFDGFDAETKGYITNRGLTDKSPADAFLAAANAHRAAEVHIGAPADQLVRLPQPNNVDSAKAFWQKLGAPADATGYDFTAATTRAEGQTPVDARLIDAVRNVAAENFLPANVAPAVAAAVVAYQDQAAASKAAQDAATLATARDALKTNWGQNYEANMFIAKQAAAALGVTPEAVSALENVAGYDKAMELFRLVGTKIGEDRFITDNTRPNQPMTVDAAKEKITQLKADQAWSKRYLEGGAEERREMDALMLLANPQS